MLKKISISFLILTFLLGLWAFWWEPSSLKIQHYEIHPTPWLEELSGLKIALLADLHTGSPFNGLEKLEKIVSLTNQQKPDLILLSGDYVSEHIWGGKFIPPEKIAPRLKKLQAPLGVFAVLGNHDWWLDGPRVKRAFEAEGIKVVENTSVKIQTQRSSFWLTGVGDFFTKHHRLQKAFENISDDFPILLFTHSPDLFPLLPERISLTIASHTHGGQVDLPFIGPPKVPSKYGQRYAGGLIFEEGKVMFVGTGIGTSLIPVRFLVPPEISILHLISK